MVETEENLGHNRIEHKVAGDGTCGHVGGCSRFFEYQLLAYVGVWIGAINPTGIEQLA